MLAPATSGAVDGVVRIPVVNILTPLTGEDTLVDIVVFAVGDIIGPVIEHVVVVLNTCRVQISRSHRPTFVGILLTRHLQRLQGEVLRITGLVQDGFPHQHTGMVAVATDDIAGVLMHHLRPLRVLVPELPARRRYDDEESQLVAGVHKRRILRIVSRTDDGHTRILQALGIAPLLRVGQGIAHISKILMTVTTHKLMIGFAVQPEAVLPTELRLADTHTDNTAVERRFAVHHL